MTMTTTATTPASTVLLTGASSGIGAALARTLAKRGHRVVVGARRTDRLQALVDDITAAGGTAVARAIDVSDRAACAKAVCAIDDEFAVDVVIANAGVGGRGLRVFDIDVDDAHEVVATNLVGALATILPLLPRMKARGRGHVVAVSSLAADLAQPAAPVYGATKAALTFFLDSVAPDLEAAGIATTIVHPGFVKSEMTAKNKFPMPFLVETDAAAVIIADAIAARKPWVRFPWALSTTMALANLLPRRVRAAVIAKNTDF